MAIPADTLVRGVNLTLGPANHADGWIGMWRDWPWTTWLKPQIDNCIALGANCFRLIGCIEVVTLGTIDQATYLARWTQLLDYLSSLGVMAYPCGGGLAYLGATTLAQAQNLLAAWATLCDGYPNVIGLDITNECFAGGAVAGMTTTSIVSYVSALTSAVRAATGKAITNDRTAHSLARWDHAEGALLDALNDFHDVHSYYSMNYTDPRPWMSKWWGRKPVIFGEYGADMTLSTAARVQRFTSAKALVENNPQFVGSLAWAASDTDTPNNTRFGLFDDTFVERTDVTAVFRTFSKVRSYYPDGYEDVYR